MKKSEFYYHVLRGMFIGEIADMVCILITIVVAFIIDANTANDFIGGLTLIFAMGTIPYTFIEAYLDFKSNDERRKELKKEN